MYFETRDLITLTELDLLEIRYDYSDSIVWVFIPIDYP